MRDRRMWCAGAIKNESCAARGTHQRRVRTASGSDRILRATQHKHLFRRHIRHEGVKPSKTVRYSGSSRKIRVTVNLTTNLVAIAGHESIPGITNERERK